MGIIASLTLIGAGGLLSVRNSSQVDAVAQELVSAIRQSQNNAMSIREGVCSSGSTTKVWGVVTKENNFYIINRCYNESGEQTDWIGEDKPLSPYPDVEILQGGNSYNGRIWYSTPFGKGWVPIVTGEVSSTWGFVDSGNFAHEYKPNAGAETFSTSDYSLVIKKGNYSREIVIQPSGDVYEK